VTQENTKKWMAANPRVASNPAVIAFEELKK
jgi:hypothetical protein